MNMHKPQVFTLVVFVVITIIGSIGWIGVLMLFWWVMRLTGFATDPWAFVEAISTAVTAAAVFSAGFIAYRELSESSDSRYMEIADKLFNELNAPEAISARRWVYQNLPNNPQSGLDGLDMEGQAAIKSVLNSLDRVAFLTQEGWIPDEVIMPWMHPMITKTWKKLRSYVVLERERRNEPYFYRYAEKLADRTQAWCEKHHIETEPNWVDHAI